MPSSSPRGVHGLVLRPWHRTSYATTDPRLLATVTAPPYDSVDPDELQRLAGRHPHSVVRLSIPHLDPHPPVSSSSPHVHAGELKATWLDDRVLHTDQAPGIYLYEYADGRTTVRGVVGLVDVDDAVLPHEDVLHDAVVDRAQLLTAAEADIEPLVLVPDDAAALTEVLQTLEPASLDWSGFTAGDSTTHRWARLCDSDAHRVTSAVSHGPALLADGHHRYAAHRLLRDAAATREDDAGAARWGRAPAVVVDQATYPLRVEPVHRVLPRLALAGCRPPEGWIAQQATATPVEGPEIRVVTGDRHELWRPTEPDERSIIERVHDDLLPAIGAHTSWRPVLTDTDQALADARACGGTALLLTPTPLRRVIEQARRGITMPAKSTAFSPKPRTGLFMHDLSRHRAPDHIAVDLSSSARS